MAISLTQSQKGQESGSDRFTLYNAVSSGNSFPADSLGTHIILIAKEGKDPLHYANYRLISLLNTNLKLFIKILVIELMTLHTQLWDNVFRVLDVIRITQSKSIPLLLFRDAYVYGTDTPTFRVR